jgi:Pro-kumamolisin, activation domain/Bacterial Ig-like domain (group 3)
LRKFCNVLSAPVLLTLAVFALSQGSQAQAALKDRITQPIESSNMSPIVGSVHPLAKAEVDQGLTDNAKVLQGMTLNFKRSAAQEASLKALLQAQQDPSSASYHTWLTPAQFGQQFGMSSADIALASAWLQQQGFTVTSVAQSNNSISFSGNIADVEKAFQTQIHNYSVNGETHFANATQISIPSVLAGTVSSIRGLNDFRLKPRLQFVKSRSAATNPHFTSGISGTHYVAPGDFATIYDVAPLLTAGNTGKGVTIAVMGQTDIVPADITDFRSAAGLSVNDPTVVTVPGTTPSTVAIGAASNDLAETDLDLEWSGGVAPGASIVLVNSDNVLTSLEYAIQNTINGITVPIISQSYGACEAAFQTSDLTTIEGYLAQANSQGQTVVLASGDTGAADCDNSSSSTVTSATQGLAVDYPGSSAYVTDLGGSEFTGDGTAASPETGAGTYWSATGTGGVSDDLITSAKSYIPEMAWNDTTYSINNGGGLSAGGGGVSSLWPKPSWQAGVPGIPADQKRDVPDISLNSSPNHDGYLYCTQVQTTGSGTAYVSSCQANSFRISDAGQSDNNNLTVAGGTSFAAPDFAGLLAIIEQKLASGGGLGNINPALYTLAANSTTYASAFHDITTGNNQVPCTTGSQDCATTGSSNVIGYAAGTGYDQATGLGSVDANNLATAFGTIKFMTGTATTLAVSPSSPLAGATVTLTATVKASSGTAAFTGTVTFTIDGTAHTGATLTNGVATTTTSFSTGGPHTVVASYTGDANYFPSTSAVTTVTVIASGTAKTTTTLVASPTTVALAGALTLTATVQSTTAGTIAGSVTFTIGSATVGTATITPGASGTGTAALAVSSATTTLGFAPGSNTIVATYGGDSSYASSSGTATVTVTNPAITLSAANMTISSPSPGNTGTSTITLTSTGGYTGTVSLSATSTLNADYLFPSSGTQTATVVLAAGGTGTTTIQITTIAATGNLQKGLGSSFHKGAGRIAAAGGTAAGCLLLLLVPGIRKKRWPVALLMLVFLSVGAGLGCGGGTGGGAPAGTYTVTISAADSSNSNIAGSTTFTVTIQ